jgi:hypothetical protein
MSADGTRAAALMPDEAGQTTLGGQVVFVLNFFDELRRNRSEN